jgi:hypothetical protein
MFRRPIIDTVGQQLFMVVMVSIDSLMMMLMMTVGDF